jgi:predicted SprT family Zn-dependent metalloprotease
MITFIGTPDHVQALVNGYLERGLERLSVILSVPLQTITKLPFTVDWSNTLRSTAGTAKGLGLIRLNARLFEKNMSELENTFLHELGHILCNRIYGVRQGHNSNWYRVTKALGGTADRCHSLDVSHIVPRIQYSCGCPDRTINITKQKHNKILKGSVYICRTCKSKILEKV